MPSRIHQGTHPELLRPSNFYHDPHQPCKTSSLATQLNCYSPHQESEVAHNADRSRGTVDATRVASPHRSSRCCRLFRFACSTLGRTSSLSFPAGTLCQFEVFCFCFPLDLPLLRPHVSNCSHRPLQSSPSFLSTATRRRPSFAIRLASDA